MTAPRIFVTPILLINAALLATVAACDDSDNEHSEASEHATSVHALEGLLITSGVTADVSAGARRIPIAYLDAADAGVAADDTVLSAGHCTTTWHIGQDGDDDAGDGTEGAKWATLHHAFDELSGEPEHCGRILIHYSAAPYSACRPDGDGGCEDQTLVTWGDGVGADSHIILQGELGPNDARPVIKAGAHQTFLTIRHKNWTVENLDVDFDGHGGRGIHVTSLFIPPDQNAKTYQHITENIVIRNNKIHNIRGCDDEQLPNIGQKADAILIMGPNFAKGEFDSLIRRIYIVDNEFSDIHLSSKVSGSCDPTNDHNRADGFGVLIWPKATDIYIAGNEMSNISGDGVQCAGSSGGENGLADGGSCDPRIHDPDDADAGFGTDCDPWNIEVVDNLMYAENADDGIQWRNASENAVDIKSCHGITVARNNVWGYLGKDAPVDAGYTTDNVKGGAFVAHYGANNVRFEENEVRDTCGLLGIGFISSDTVQTVDDVLVRSNLFVRAKAKCEGGGADGIKINNANHVDINNNTLVFPEMTVSGSPRGKGLIVGYEPGAKAHNVDIWNNIIDNPEFFVDHDVGQAGNLRVRTNHFHTSWNQDTRRMRARDYLDASPEITVTGTKFETMDFGTTSTYTFEDYGTWQNDWSSDDFVSDAAFQVKCDSSANKNAHTLDIGPRTWNGSTFVDNPSAPLFLGWNQTPTVACLSIPRKPRIVLNFCDFMQDSSLCLLQALIGSWNAPSGHAVANGAGGLLLSSSPLTWPDVEITTSITLDGSNQSGLVARVVDDDTYYGVRLHVGEGIELFRRVNGIHTTLGMHGAMTIADATRYELRLRVRDRHPVRLEAWLDSSLVLDVTDSGAARIINAGKAGLLSGDTDDTIFDNVEVAVPEKHEAAPETLLLHEDFSTCADSEQPDPDLWSVEGTYYCQSERLRGESAEDLALIHGIDAYNAQMRARVRLNSNADLSGVVARAEGGSYYVARLDRSNQVRLERIDEYGTTLLAGYSTTIDPDISYRLELRAVGWLPVELDVYLESDHIISYTDDSPRRLTTGHFGLLSGSTGRTQLDDVYVTAK